MNYKDWIFSVIGEDLKEPKEENYKRWCKSRELKKVEFRNAIVHVLIEEGHLTREEIGNLLNKHHSSITTAYQVSQDWLDCDLAYYKPYQDLVNKLTINFLETQGKGLTNYEDFYKSISKAVRVYDQSKSEDFYDFVSGITKKFNVSQVKAIV